MADSKLVRPGNPRVPCLAILDYKTSKLKLVNLDGGSSGSVKISDGPCQGIVTDDGEVYAVTYKEILKLHSDGSKTILQELILHEIFSKVVLFQKKIYIIQTRGKSMLCFDPADNSLTDDLPGCGLGDGFCALANDDFICAMGGWDTETRAMKYDPPTGTWEDTAPMWKERYDAAAATLDGKIYVMGGLGSGGSVEYYNPDNNSWTEIPYMNVRHEYFSACVVGDQLYAVGGDQKKKNGFYQQSIEVYDKNKWTIVTKFQTQDCWTRSCFWPHGSDQPGFTQPTDLPESVEKGHDRLQSENLLKTKKGKIVYAGCKVGLMQGDSSEEKEIASKILAPKDESLPSPTFKLDEDFLSKNMSFIDGEIKLSHGLFQCGENFLSVVCYHSPRSLYQQIVAHLKKISFKEIYRDNFLMNNNQEVPIRMECFDVDLHKFEPQQYLLSLSNMKSRKAVAQCRFLLRHLKEPKDEVDIRYIVDGFPAPLAVIVPPIKETDSERFDLTKFDSRFDSEKKVSGSIWNEGMGSNAQVNVYRPPINMDRRTVAISDAILDSDKRQLELQSQPRNAEKEIGPEGGNLSLDECSFIIAPGAIAFQSIDECSFTIPPDSKSVMPYKKINDQLESELIAVKSNEAETAGGIAGEIPDKELSRLGFRHSRPHAVKEVGPEGEKLSHDECSLAIPSKSLVDTRNLSALQPRSVSEFAIPSKSLVDTRNLRISVSMDFQKLALPANRIPVSPYFGVNFDGKLRIPAKARVPTWFKASEDSNHGIKIYKRYRDEENKLVWRELQNEVKVHDDVIEFEVDHCCGFLATIQDWIYGEIKLSHGLFQLKRNFQSVVCYRSPKSLFQNADAELKEMGYKKIYRADFQTKTKQRVPIKMECYKMDLHKFDPPEYLFTPPDLKTQDFILFPFLLQHLIEPKDEVDIRYVVNNFPAPLAVTLPATKDGNVPVNIFAKQVAIGEGASMFGDNAIAGSQEITDHSVTAGKAIYGQSTSSTVGENITVHRTGK